MSVFQVIAHNLLGFDLIIFVAAALNGVCYYFARKNADRLYRKLHMIVFVPSRRNDPDSVSKAIRDSRDLTDGHCKGIFYWAPEARPRGGYALGAFGTDNRPSKIMQAYVEAAQAAR